MLRKTLDSIARLTGTIRGRTAVAVPALMESMHVAHAAGQLSVSVPQPKWDPECEANKVLVRAYAKEHDMELPSNY